MASSSNPASFPGTSSKVSQSALEATIGALLGITILVACGRTYARVSFFQRQLVDDLFFYLATIMLIAGTGLLYAEAPYIYLQVKVQTGVEIPPAEFIPKLIRGLKIESAMTVMFAGAHFSVKFSFLFFLRHLIWQSKRLMLWWWVVVGVCAPSAIVFMCTSFFVCATFDESISGSFHLSYLLLTP